MNGSVATDDQIFQWGLFLKSGYQSDPIKYFQMSPFFGHPFCSLSAYKSSFVYLEKIAIPI